MILVLASLALVAPTAAQQPWSALPSPRLCLEEPPARDPDRLPTGSHLLLPGDRVPGRPGLRPHLPLATLRRLLEDESRRESLGFELHPSASIFAARGAPEGLLALQERLDDLDRAAASLEIEVSWAHTPDGAAPTAEAFETLTLLSGETGMLGSRRTRPFLHSYTVEVAHDSGVADPVIGRIVTGRTLHVTPGRLEGGARVHVEGLLDCSELLEVLDFDPGTPDLGKIQIPTVRALQVAFSGFVDSGELLRIDIAGSGLDELDGTLWIRARTGPDAESAPVAWRVRDVAWLERRVESLPLPGAGAGIDDHLRGEAPRALWAPLSAFDLLQSSSQFLDRDRARPTLEAAQGMVFGPLSDAATWGEVDALADAAERERTRHAGRLLVSSGDLRVSLPVSAGASARVLHGTERTWLVDYDVTLAPETWMPIPEVQRAFDGISVEAELAGDRLSARGFTASTLGSVELTPAETALAGLLLPERAWQTGRVRLAAGQSTRLVDEGPQGRAIDLRVE